MSDNAGSRFLVIGSGIVGASVAEALDTAGSEVFVASRPYPGTASAASFAWLNANTKLDADYHVLNVLGMHEHGTLARRLGSDWLKQSGNLEVLAPSQITHSLEQRLEKLRELGYPFRLLTPAAALQLEPALAHAQLREGALHFPSEGYVELGLLRSRLLTGLRKKKRVNERAAVTGLEEHSDKVTVSFEHGEAVDVGHVVIAAGADTGRLASLGGWQPPATRGEAGAHLITSGGSSGLQRIIHAPGFSARPDGNGRIMLRNSRLDATIGAPEKERSVVERALLQEARQWLGDWSLDASIEERRNGIRPVPEDGMPMIGYLPGSERIYVLAMHSGVTLGPLVGRLAAQELTSDKRLGLLNRYRPERFDAPAPTTRTHRTE